MSGCSKQSATLALSTTGLRRVWSSQRCQPFVLPCPLWADTVEKVPPGQFKRMDSKIGKMEFHEFAYFGMD
jgi:hypothetical protein